jgi:hypothetical protein
MMKAGRAESFEEGFKDTEHRVPYLDVYQLLARSA